MPQDRLAYLNALGSLPWSQENTCWHFVQRVRRDLFGVDDLPTIAPDLVSHPERRKAIFDSHSARSDWIEVKTPQDGDLAIMTKAHDLHVGIWLLVGSRGLIWHSDIGHNLVSETIMEVTQLRRWKLTFYRHA
ncbi:hypothetical protein FHR70_003722 [Microvirga lupini]|uniref:NlpC/P60 family protein n=1 Tax=Microvirga lupini TaxID=420324 RepID=A0A7W4VP46_9HYPH|nr:hypothetical protein [Microvirga lupini]MBB3020636.1 hypothetical protein [Microvirga lupini]